MELTRPSESMPAVGRQVLLRTRGRYRLGYLRFSGRWESDDNDPNQIEDVEGWAPLPPLRVDTMAMLFPPEDIRIDGRRRSSA